MLLFTKMRRKKENPVLSHFKIFTLNFNKYLIFEKYKLFPELRLEYSREEHPNGVAQLSLSWAGARPEPKHSTLRRKPC